MLCKIWYNKSVVLRETSKRHATELREELAMLEVNTTVHDIRVRSRRKPTDEEVAEMERQEVAREQAIIRKVLTRGMSKDVLRVTQVEGLDRFYSVELAPMLFDKRKYYVDCYLEARSKISATVLIYDPQKTFYRAFWVYGEEVNELIEDKTKELAKHIFELRYAPIIPT